MGKPVKKHSASGAKRRESFDIAQPHAHESPLTDEQLLAKLRTLGIELDRASLEPLCDENPSTKQIALRLMGWRASGGAPIEPIRNCLVQLRQRWFPDKPSFEILDARILVGYGLLQQRDFVSACDVWLEAWEDFLSLIDKTGSQSLEAFDRQFGGTEYATDWIQEFEHELWNAGIEQPRFFTARIRICEEGLRRFATDDPLAIENRRRFLAESYFELGNTAKTEALYRDWLTADPQWGWGWIGWSHCYQFARAARQDLKRAEQILLEGLSIAQVRDTNDVTERLARVYEDQDRVGEANELYQRIGASRAPATTTLSKAKVGRNDPCPCGSGKKFKKCCGSG